MGHEDRSGGKHEQTEQVRFFDLYYYHNNMSSNIATRVKCQLHMPGDIEISWEILALVYWSVAPLPPLQFLAKPTYAVKAAVLHPFDM